MLIVYRLSDKEILFNSGKSFVEPEGMSDINGKLTVIERVGGDLEDYGVYRLHDIDNAAQVEELLNAYNYTLVFGDDESPAGFIITKTKAEHSAELPEPGPTPAELLREDNASLWYENMIQSAKVESNETEVAGLWYSLMMGGI